MLTSIEKVLFLLLAAGSLYFAGVRFYDVYRAIARGRPDSRLDNLRQRILRALWIVFTQQSVFKTRPIVSFLHALIFYGFVFYFLVNLVDVLEGFVSFDARGGPWGPFNWLADLADRECLARDGRSGCSPVLRSPQGLCFPAQCTNTARGSRRNSARLHDCGKFHPFSCRQPAYV